MSQDHLPSFNSVQAENLSTSLQQLLEQQRAKIKDILAAQSTPPTWASLMTPLEELDNQLHHFWSPVSHLHSVKNTDALRQAYEQCLPLLTEFSNEIGQNQELYNASKQLLESSEYKELSTAQKQILKNDIRDFKLAGVALDSKKQQQFCQLTEKLAQLCNQFAVNTLDATQAFTYHTDDIAELEGIPEFALQQAQALAKQKSLTGYAFSLDAPSYIPIMQYAKSSKLRQHMHHAYMTRASELGPNAGEYDNSKIINDILSARHQLAQLLEYPQYADYALTTKMLKQPEQVLEFLNQLTSKSLPQAKKEYAELQEFAKSTLNINKLAAWDVGYAAEQLRQSRYDISDTVLRPYFPAPHVLSGLFAILKKLFNIEIIEVPDADTWDQQVQCYAVKLNAETIAYFYLDLYTREHKRGGAWMDDCQIRRRLANGSIQLPIAFITCNFNPPIDGKPALLSHDDVITLFHECGHALQHMLTQMEYSGVSGINGVPWDAVEVPSQFLENWAWSREGIDLISCHVETGQQLPNDLFTKMLKAKHFQAGMRIVRQLEFALFDFKLHLSFTPEQKNAVQSTLDNIRQQVCVVPVPAYNRFANSFGHIFAGGYAAGYYSYLWAEVMAQDAFSLFLENGLFDADTSQAFHDTFLACGGSVNPLELFINFRGREPNIDALLKSHGIHIDEKTTS